MGEEKVIEELDLLFIAYLTQSGKTKKELAESLNVCQKTMTKMWRMGVGQWRFDEVIKAARFLGIPIDVLRETIKYRKDK